MERNVVVTVFNIESEGYQALSEIRQAAVAEDYLVSAGALIKKENGACALLDGFDTGADTANDAVMGGLIGMLAGVLAGPIGMLLGGSYGALVGMNVDATEAVFGVSMLEQIADKLDDGMVAFVALVDEKEPEALDAKLSAYDAVIARFDAEAVAADVDRAYEMQDEMARQARMELRKERKADFEAKATAAGDLAEESAKQGAANFLDDAARVKASVEEISDDKKAAKEAEKAERKAKFDSAVNELKDSFEQGADKYEADSAVLMDSLKGIAEDAGIDIKENNAVAEAFKALKESFEEGFEALKADAAFTKGAVDEIADDQKAAKQAKKDARSKKFDDAVEAMKKSLE